jgi:hypothetical protein
MAYIDNVAELEALAVNVGYFETQMGLADVEDFEDGFDYPGVTLPFSLSMALLRVRIGLAATDPTQDANIFAAITVATEIIEDYLDRKLEYANELETFIHQHGYSLSLIRYPVERINSLSRDVGTDIRHHIDKRNGVLAFDGYIYDHEVKVDYVGGYVKLPAALEMALLSVFDRVYASVYTPDAPVAESVRTVKAGDLSITYETNTALYRDAVNSGVVSQYLPPEIVGLLSLYRRENT